MNERDLLGASSMPDGSMAHAVLEWGTVGWDDDNEQTSFGAGTDDGMTLVKVTLYRGRRPGTGRPLQPGLAAGLPVIAHVDARLFQALAAGARVIVGFPGGDIRTPGNGMILGVAAKSPTGGFDASTMMLQVPDGSTLNIGDAAAAFLAVASKVQTALDALKVAAQGSGTWLTVANIAGSFATLYTALGGTLTPDPTHYQSVATTKIKGT